MRNFQIFHGYHTLFLNYCTRKIVLQSTFDMSESKFIPNCWYLKVDFLGGQKIYFEISVVWNNMSWNVNETSDNVPFIAPEIRDTLRYQCLRYQEFTVISIFHGCMVLIEKSITRVTDQHHEACRVMPNSDPESQIFLSIPYSHDRYFFLHTFLIYHIWFSKKNLVWNNTFSFKGFYWSWKKSTLPATAVRFFMFTSNLHKVTSFFDVTAVKTNVTRRCRYVTSYTTNALNTRDFYPVLGEITWVR